MNISQHPFVNNALSVSPDCGCHVGHPHTCGCHVGHPHTCGKSNLDPLRHHPTNKRSPGLIDQVISVSPDYRHRWSEHPRDCAKCRNTTYKPYTGPQREEPWGKQVISVSPDYRDRWAEHPKDCANRKHLQCNGAHDAEHFDAGDAGDAGCPAEGAPHDAINCVSGECGIQSNSLCYNQCGFGGNGDNGRANFKQYRRLSPSMVHPIYNN
jgi:hypothetical protein